MPRQPRFKLADVPQHVVQRGNNRQPTFIIDSDYERYLEYLASASAAHRCEVHAYVLMPNHVHLLVTPRDSLAVSRMMQSLGGRYVQYVNATHRRSGTLWGGRYKSNIVESERYLMTCYRYIEMNPVRASLARHAADYRWSSHGHNAIGKDSDIIVEHALYQALGASLQERRSAYRELFPERMDDALLRKIRDALNQGRVLADEDFRTALETKLSRSLKPARRGRPWSMPQPVILKGSKGV